jgi:hypothetical protein
LPPAALIIVDLGAELGLGMLAARQYANPVRQTIIQQAPHECAAECASASGHQN